MHDEKKLKTNVCVRDKNAVKYAKENNCKLWFNIIKYKYDFGEIFISL